MLSQRIWDLLSSPVEHKTRIYVGLTAVDSQKKLDGKSTVMCWASLDKDADNQGLSIPAVWSKVYPSTFKTSPFNEIFIKSATPTPLTAIVVTALSSDAYSQASTEASPLEAWFSAEPFILRQGDIFQIPPKSSAEESLQYRLEMLEPVLQGYARRGVTKIVLLSSSDELSTPQNSADSEDNEEEDLVEIDESFLASSFSMPSEPKSYEQESEQSPLSSDGPLSVGYVSQHLYTPFNVSEDHCTFYVRPPDLGKLGILSGDWAIAGIRTSNSRLVRVVANDDIVKSQGFVAGSPLLMHNTIADEAEAFSQSPPAIHIRPSPFGSSNPTIPTARSITLARIASPISINRQYQQLCIDALKTYFDSGKKLMKQGDLLALPIDTDLSRRTTDEEETVGPIRNGHDEVRWNEVVFFKVTNIEYDVMPRPNSSVEDTYTGSVLGELGCWIDSSITRMVQTGVEHSRVPNVCSYMNLDFPGIQYFTKLSTQPSSHLLGPKSPFSKIVALASASLSQRAVDYDLQLSFLLKGGRSIGKFTVASWVAQYLGLHLFEINCYDILGESDVKTEATLQVRLEQARECTPCLLVMRHLEALSQTTQAAEPGKEPAIVSVLKEALESIQNGWRLTGYPVIVLGTTSESGRVPANLLSCFKQEVAFEAPNEGERLEILECLLGDHTIASDVSVPNLATQTAALLAGDLHDLVARARAASIERAANTIPLAGDELLLRQVPLTAADFDVALGKARDSYSESIGAPKIPSVSWDDVGGLAHVKSDILDTIQLPLDHPELFADGLKKRSGILLYGPPGTGKTLIAKAVATSCNLNFFSVKGPELLNMYIGESEANVRRVFQRARDAKPCVIFFDELDSVAPKRGNHGDSGGVMDRIVSQLLAELDGMSGGSASADVFVIGATNRPDLLDPALLRPGRFDRMLYLGVSDTHEAQLNILEALTRKFRLDPDLDLRNIANKCPFNYTGADFYALCSDAMLNAMSRKAEEIEEKILKLNAQPGPYSHPHPITPQYYLAELASPEDIVVYVSEKDFERALEMLIPSVSQGEMEHYAQVQRRFSQNDM